MIDDMSQSPGGRESPISTASSTTASGSGSVIGSVGSGSNGCRNSGASFDSGRATSTTFQGVRYSGGLSSESSLGSFRHSYHSSNSSLGSIPSEEIRNFDVAAMISQGVPDHEILNAWLTGLHLECYYQNFIQAGYDMHTISRMTPEDLNAIGVTKPHHRKRIKSEISQLNISEGLPDYIPDSIEEWLRILKLEDYLHKLLDQGYHNVRQITNITWEDLDDIGILKLGHQKKFMLAIKRVQDILSGKRVPSSYVPNAYLTPVPDNNCPFTQQQQLSSRPSASPSMPYSHPNPQIPHYMHQQSTNQYHHPQPPSVTDPRHIIQRNHWPHQAQTFQQQQNSKNGGMSHQIQIHHPPVLTGIVDPHNPNLGQQSNTVQTLYHPEVISIRVKNGHAINSLDSPPEEEPIYGTSSFLPSNSNSTSGSSGGVNLPPNHWQQQQPRGNLTLKSYEDGEITPTNGYVNMPNGNGNGVNLSMTKQSMSNTWTLPRLQKNKPISKVMGGGGHSNSCDSSVTYPINPGPLLPQQLAIPTPIPSCTTFGKGLGNNSNPGDYSMVNKSCPPPPPRRTTCSSLGQSQQLDEDNLPLPPPPVSSEENELIDRLASGSLQSSNPKPTVTFANDPHKIYGMSSSYYGQQITNSTSYHSTNSLENNSLSNGTGSVGGFRSTLPITKSRDPSPAGSDYSDLDLPSNNGLFTKGVKRNGSDASFKSNSSTESESIPFANDNAGTIKQLKRMTSQSVAVGCIPTNENSIELEGLGQSEQRSGGEASDVLSDIGCMLADLTTQLDAILEQERSSKH